MKGGRRYCDKDWVGWALLIMDLDLDSECGGVEALVSFGNVMCTYRASFQRIWSSHWRILYMLKFLNTSST